MKFRSRLADFDLLCTRKIKLLIFNLIKTSRQMSALNNPSRLICSARTVTTTRIQTVSERRRSFVLPAVVVLTVLVGHAVTFLYLFVITERTHTHTSESKVSHWNTLHFLSRINVFPLWRSNQITHCPNAFTDSVSSGWPAVSLYNCPAVFKRFPLLSVSAHMINELCGGLSRVYREVGQQRSAGRDVILKYHTGKTPRVPSFRV